MAATRASGTTAVRYGTMRENGAGPDGGARRRPGDPHRHARPEVVGRLRSDAPVRRLGGHARRHHRGDAAPAPAARGDRRRPSAAFDDASRARSRRSITTIQLGIPVARIELLDEVQIEAVNRYSKPAYAVQPTLFFEFHGDSERNVAEQAEAVQAHRRRARRPRLRRWADATEDRAKLWHARHNALYAALALRPGAQAWTTDVCVPISRLAECILETNAGHRDASFAQRRSSATSATATSTCSRASIPDTPTELAEAERLNARLVARALAMGGTCTGEHGVGHGKMEFLDAEHGEALDGDADDQARARPRQPDEPRQARKWTWPRCSSPGRQMSMLTRGMLRAASRSTRCCRPPRYALVSEVRPAIRAGTPTPLDALQAVDARRRCSGAGTAEGRLRSESRPRQALLRRRRRPAASRCRGSRPPTIRSRCSTA